MLKELNIEQYKTGNQIELNFFPTDKFKTNLIQLYLVTPLRQDLASKTALIPYLLYRGSEKYPASLLLERQLEELYGADLNFALLKRGENQIISIALELINEKYLPTKIPLLEEGLKLLAEILLHPLFKEEHLKQEKEFLAKEIAALKDDKQAYALEKCNQLMCSQEAFATYKLGSIEELKLVERQGIIKHYDNLLAKSYLSLFCIGDIPQEQVIKLVEELFTFPHQQPVQINHTLFVKSPTQTKEHIEEMDVKQGKLVLGFRTGINRQLPDYYALLLYDGILGAYAHSKLFQNLREKHSLAYYAYSQLESTKGLLNISAGIDFGQYEKARDLILEQVEDMARGKISAAEIEWTKKSLINSLKSLADSNRGLANFYFLGRLNEKLDSIPEIIQKIEGLKKEEIVSAAQKVKLDTIYFLTRREAV